MTTKNLAVIDMGTNTFHLLIVERSNCEIGFREIYRDRHYVFLAEDGIFTISSNALHRAQKAIDAFAQELNEYKSLELTIVGTEALRVASNCDRVTSYVEEKLGDFPNIISGEREAELIYLGNKLIVGKKLSPYLIMDIGGGSTEFILAGDSGIIFSNSYPMGVTKLYNDFNDTDPISLESINKIEIHLEQLLTDLTLCIKSHNLNGLIGASGSFEVLSSVLTGDIPQKEVVNISLSDFEALSAKMIASTIDERRAVQGIPENRTKLIQVAFVMMRKIIRMYSPELIGVSPYALKEGLISEWLAE